MFAKNPLPLASRTCLDALREAAILGDSFDLRVLAQFSTLSKKYLRSAIQAALRAQLLSELPTDETQAVYRFQHSSLPRALLKSLSLRRVRSLHLEAAHALEFIYKDDLPACSEKLADHYISTCSIKHFHRAIDYLLIAAERDCKAGQCIDAANHLRRALDLADRLKAANIRQADILNRLAAATLSSSTVLTESQNVLRAALRLYSQSDDQRKVAEIHAKLSVLLALTSESINLNDALEHSRAAWNFLNTIRDDLTLGTLSIGDAIAGHAQFHTGDAIAASGRAMAIGERLHNEDMWCEAAALHGHLLCEMGFLDGGLSLMEKAFARSMPLADVKPVFGCAWLLAFSCDLLWDPRAAESFLEPALARLNSGQAGYFRDILLAHLGISHAFAGRVEDARAIRAGVYHPFFAANVCFLEGRFAEAEEILETGIARAQAADSAQQEWVARCWLGRFRRALKLYAPAEGQLRSALGLLTGALRIPEEIFTRAELALLLAQTDRVTEALLQIEQGEALMSNQDWRALQGFVHRAKAMAWAKNGCETDANGEFEKALTLFARYGVKPEEAEVLVLWGEWLSVNGEPHLGREKFGSACRIYHELKFGPRWLERCAGEAGAEWQMSVSKQQMRTSQVKCETAELSSSLGAQQRHSEIYSRALTEDLSLLATLMHNAIAHAMDAIDKLAKAQKPFDEIAKTITATRDICQPIERIAQAFEAMARSPIHRLSIARTTRGHPRR